MFYVDVNQVNRDLLTQALVETFDNLDVPHKDVSHYRNRLDDDNYCAQVMSNELVVRRYRKLSNT